MKNLKIVFMGTPEFAVTTLKHLYENNFQIVGVITAPDRPAGRGQKIKTSAVKDFAMSHNLKVLQPTNLKDEAFIKELKELQANLQIVVAFRMLPKVVWDMPTYGTFNLHASLLPAYRGAAPINWAVINGETETGNTTFFIDDKIDTGEIILQQKLSISENETAGELHNRLMVEGAKLVQKTVELIAADKAATKPQPEGKNKTAYKLNKSNTKINWDNNAITIHNQIRGLSPYPSAWCQLKNGDKTYDVKILESVISDKSTTLSPGKIWIEDKKLLVATANGTIEILKLQLPGKKPLKIKEILNGYSFDNDAFFS